VIEIVQKSLDITIISQKLRNLKKIRDIIGDNELQMKSPKSWRSPIIPPVFEKLLYSPYFI